jgi:phytoene dehydrogenase-like protein
VSHDGVLVVLWCNSSAWMQIAVVAYYARSGAAYPAGGGNMIVRNIIPHILTNGGAVLCGCAVDQLIVEDEWYVYRTTSHRDSFLTSTSTTTARLLACAWQTTPTPRFTARPPSVQMASIIPSPACSLHPFPALLLSSLTSLPRVMKHHPPSYGHLWDTSPCL